MDTDDETFCKRPGTTDKGKPFEDLSIANYILKFLYEEKLTNFKLSANDKNYGAFDDIILEIESNKKLKTFAIQLKHVSDNNKQLTLKALTAESGDFSLKKYYESFKKEINKPCQLILLSNIKFGSNNDQKNKDNIQIQLGNDTLIICKKNLNEMISTSGKCYQFKLATDNSSPEIKEYEEFLEKFFLYTDQPNVNEIKYSVQTLFQKMFGESADYDKYIKFIDDWNKREKPKEKLNKNFMQRVITMLLVKSFIIPFVFDEEISENIKKFRETISEYNITTFDKKFQNKVTKLWGDKLILNDVKELNKTKIKYQMDCGSVENVDDIDKTNLSIFLWLLNDIPLIVSYNEIVYNAIKLCKNKKFVLLQDNFKQIKIENCRIFQNLHDLSNNKILTNFKWCIQRKKEKNLNYLIELNKDFNKTVVTTNELIQMIDGSYKIDDKKENFPEPYIERQLTKNVVDYRFLDKLAKNTLVLIDCVNDDIINSKLNKSKLIKVEDFLNGKGNKMTVDKNLKMRTTYESSSIFISEQICGKHTFEKLCTEKTDLKSCFHFRVDSDGNLEWIRSKGNFQTLEKFRLNNIYINEMSLCSTKIENEINLIITEAGMGKSEMFKHLKNNFFENYWIVLLTAKDLPLLCDYFSNQTINKELFFEYLLNHKLKNIPNFDKEVLKLFLKENKTIYLWDALDELSEERQETIINLISQLSKNNCYQWITSRRHLKQKLETRFEVLSRELVPFNTEQQEFYIEERLKMSHLPNIKEIKQKIIKAISQIQDNDILAIPLQIFLMTELFRQNSEKYLVLVKDLFSLADLYKHFIEEKFNLYCKEKADIKNTTCNDQSKKMCETLKKTTLQKYEEIAIKILYPKSFRKKINIYLEENSEPIDDLIGLLSKISKDEIQFLHITYAEFLVANYFFKHLDKVPNFEEIIFHTNYTNVRLFFDLLLAKHSEPHIALLYKNYEFMKNINTEELKHCKDLKGRNLLHLACSWGQRYCFFNVEIENQFYVIDDKDECNNKPDSTEYDAILSFLLRVCDIEEKDRLFKINAYDYADKTNCIYARIKILQKQTVKSKLDDETGCNLMYYSAKFGYTEALELFEKIPLIITKKKHDSLLHLSVHWRNFVSKLFEFDNYKKIINYKNKLGETALHLSATFGCNKVAKILLSAGAEIDTDDIHSKTPLHFAAYYNRKTIGSLLIESDADVNNCDMNGGTPLHCAAIKGNDKVGSILINQGADINACDKYGGTPLHCASINGHKKIASLLVEKGAKVNIGSTDEITPLHCASINGHKKIASLLIKANADVNACDKYGRTPLHDAAYNRHHKIELLLIKKGADTNICDKYGEKPLLNATKNGNNNTTKSPLALKTPCK